MKHFSLRAISLVTLIAACSAAPTTVDNAGDSGGGFSVQLPDASAGGEGGSGGIASIDTGGTAPTGGTTGNTGGVVASTGGIISIPDSSAGGTLGDSSVSTGGITGTGGTDVSTSTGGSAEDGYVPPPPCTVHECVLTQGYWKLHPSDWADQSLIMGEVAYTQDQCLSLLNLPSYSDGSVILAKQLIAALLNGGACDPNIMNVVEESQVWMSCNKDADGTLPYNTLCINPDDVGCPAVELGATLDEYNNGRSGTPSCD